MKTHSSSIFFLLSLFICFTLLLISGCSSKIPNGAWQVDREAQKSFKTATVLPDHTYYYLGSSSAPASVVAISNEFVLRTRVWARVDISENILRGWRQWHTAIENSSCRYFGGVILAPDGRQAGVWYSQNIINTVRMPEPGVLEIFQPVSTSGRECGERERERVFQQAWTPSRSL
ncbi:hypothetical protein [Desulfobulbus alkaliphilus]|uniref:hypothetical protein n=1 Tax=Desulfobulbus alkaliphilus TaxID=869814 RepID=UPI0019638AB1|nr:hypothetical protein [Desulfobulbus alkaliphilus]MBM9536490.1 hypothetical protein [Desulfobulbus alkaliphilus]